MCFGEEETLPGDHHNTLGGSQSVTSAFPLLFTDGVVDGAVIPLARDGPSWAGTWSLNT